MTLKNQARAFSTTGLCALLFIMVLVSDGLAKETVLQTQANVIVEITFTAARTYADPFNDVTMDVVFRNPHDEELRVPAFWVGSNIWKVRYASPVEGKHTFRSVSSDTTDLGLNGVTGAVQVEPYTGDNPLYRHGPLRVSANHRYLEHVDGTPFFWLGDTWWMGLSHRLHWPEDFQQLAADRKEKGFNVIQIVAGLYPDMYPFDPRGANEAGFPWETNYARIRPEYFDAADQRYKYLVDQGFTPCIVGAWGYFLPWMGVDKAKAHWRYLIARYGALPVVWCVAGEANLPWYRAKGFPYDDREQVKGWTEVAHYLRATDPFHRPMTIHPTGINRLSARHAMNDLSLIDFDMLQTPHGQDEAVAPTVRTVRESYADSPVMPVIDGEASYERLGDFIPTEWTRQMFWLCLMNGAAGHTYGANGIWQVNRRGDPHGPSPTEGSPPTGYGVIAWDDAMRLPGSGQVGLGKKLLQQYEWWKFQPHPEWAEFESRPWLNLKDAQWIWYPLGEPIKDAPTGKRFFRKVFVLPEGQAAVDARLRVSADDLFEARLNGKELGGSANWRIGRQFANFASLLKPGTNILAIMTDNQPVNIPNPAGLIATMEIQFIDGSFKLASDDSWRCSTNESAGWDAVDFDDAAWVKALPEAPYGDGPWGKLQEPSSDPLHGPQSTGIHGVVRITYAPRNEPILERELGSRVAYKATCFDPVTGAKTDLGVARADDDGRMVYLPLNDCEHDWVLILESAGGSDPAHMDTHAEKPLPWPGGRIPYDISKLSPAQQTNALRAMQRWMDTGAQILFVPRTTEIEYVNFTGNTSAGNNTSQVGFQKDVRTDINITAFWWKQGEWMPAHELGHVLGFFHEHARWDRDQFVTIHYENIKPGRESDYDWVPRTNWIISSTPYDYRSIMHYRTCWASRCESECRDGDGSSPCAVIDPIGTNYDAVIGQWGDNKISALDAEKARLVYGAKTTAAANQR